MTGIDFSAFQAEYDRAQIRAELGIPASSLVVGHVASFRHQKNHRFLVEIAQELLLRQPDAIFLLVGKGELKPSIEQLVHTRGIDHAFRFLGERTDVARILHAADVFVLPSLYEGLPRVLLEAQAAGLPCIASNNITSEASAWPGSVLYLGPSDSPQIWAQNVIEAAQASLSPTRGQEVIRRFEDRGLTITANAKELTDLYETIAGR
jgi:glycosyltransferase involved in cell wall biosynthesis